MGRAAMSVPAEEEGSLDQAVFASAQVLSNSETSLVLGKWLAKKNQLPGFQLAPMIKKTRTYVERFSNVKAEATATRIRELLNGYIDLKEFESGMLMNLSPTSLEECFALIPTLQDGRISDDELRQLLADLEQYRTFEA